MKFTALILLSACLGVSAGGHSQQITLKEKNAPIQKVLEKIQNQSGFIFWYEDRLLQKAKPVDIDVQNASLERTLQLLFKEQPLAYEIIGKTIAIKERSIAFPGNEKPLPPSPIDIKGRVTNESNEPVAASIIVKGTQNGTTTNTDGYFELKNVDDNATLVITGVSVEKMEVKVNGRTDLATIRVKAKVTEGEEILVKAGYYDVKKREMTGNISRVDSKTIEKQPVTNVLAALTGRMPGVYIQQRTGTPGGGFNIQIRGRNSIREAGNNPLYVLDGVPFTGTSLASGIGEIIPQANPLNVLNPSDILSIEVLKDADATAIYGSRGANGVVLITTKKGKPGKTSVDINIYTGVGKITNMVKLLNTEQYLEMRSEAFTNDGATPQSWDYDVNGTWDKNRYTDWQKVLMGGTSHTTNVQSSISFGSTNTQFLFRGGYYRETTVFPGDFAYQRGSGLFSVNHISDNQKFNFNLSASYANDDNNLPSQDITNRALNLSPNAPALYNADGTLNWENSTWENPLAVLQRPYESKTNSLNTNVLIGYKILPALQIKANVGYSSLKVNEFAAYPIGVSDPAYGITTGGASFSNTGINTWILEPQMEYQHNLFMGKLTALIGTTFQQNIQEGQRINADGIPSNALLRNSGAATSLFSSNNYTKYKYNAFFGRLNYNLKGKYLINLTGRRDGSSRFGAERQFANFGAVGASWILSKERFIENLLSILSFSKLRFSYGTTGSDQIGDYGFLDTYGTFGTYQGSGLTSLRLANPDYAWENVKKLEVALEVGFLNDRIFFATNWYRNRSSNQLVGYSLSRVTGFPNIQFNLPATVQNTGWEFELTSENIKSKNIFWTTTINLTIPKNKLLKYPNIAGSSYANTYVIGEPLNIKKSFKFSKVDAQSGFYQFVDIDGDGTVTYPNDYQAVNEIGLKFYGGFQNTIKYKHLQLDVFFQFVNQIARNPMTNFSMPGTRGNQPIEILKLKRWQKPGDIVELQKFSQDFGSGYSAFNYWNESDIGYQNSYANASFIRLKNISLSLEVTELLKTRTPFRGKFFIQGQNLLTITKSKYPDPENLGSAFIPPLKMLTVGFQFTF